MIEKSERLIAEFQHKTVEKSTLHESVTVAKAAICLSRRNQSLKNK
jgi:hypothetical protein